jgi:hypothetical protein
MLPQISGLSSKANHRERNLNSPSRSSLRLKRTLPRSALPYNLKVVSQLLVSATQKYAKYVILIHYCDLEAHGQRRFISSEIAHG